MRIAYTDDVQKAVYGYDEWYAILGRADFDLEGDVTCIRGADVPDGFTKDVLLPDCGYVFRNTLNGGYTAARVTMHPKTAANIARWSERYGSASVMREVLNDNDRRLDERLKGMRL